ncbi:MAG: hypothetical protein ACKO4W_14110 [Bacteroidota bacterium]
MEYYGCHEHNRANTLAEHREEGISNINDCARCHKSPDEHGEGEEDKHEEKNRHNTARDDD